MHLFVVGNTDTLLYILDTSILTCAYNISVYIKKQQRSQHLCVVSNTRGTLYIDADARPTTR